MLNINEQWLSLIKIFGCLIYIVYFWTRYFKEVFDKSSMDADLPLHCSEWRVQSRDFWSVFPILTILFFSPHFSRQFVNITPDMNLSLTMPDLDLDCFRSSDVVCGVLCSFQKLSKSRLYSKAFGSRWRDTDIGCSIWDFTTLKL